MQLRFGRLLGNVSFAVGVLAAGCSGSGAVAPDPRAYLRVLNTSSDHAAIDVLVGGQEEVLALSYGNMSPVIPVAAGAQTVVLRHAGYVFFAPASASITMTGGDTVTVFALDSSNVVNSWVLTDTGKVVAAGKSKLRVVHFAHSAPAVLFYRSQPDHPTPVDVMFPFDYRNVSPYLESTPGSWTVYMSTAQYDAGGMPVQQDTLHSSGPIDVPAGQSRTVVFLDGASNGFAVLVLTP
jgi:Domain of unknown function (DUF4397)